MSTTSYFWQGGRKIEIEQDATEVTFHADSPEAAAEAAERAGVAIRRPRMAAPGLGQHVPVFVRIHHHGLVHLNAFSRFFFTFIIGKNQGVLERTFFQKPGQLPMMIHDQSLELLPLFCTGRRGVSFR